MDISFDNLRQAEGILDNLNEIKEKVEQLKERFEPKKNDD